MHITLNKFLESRNVNLKLELKPLETDEIKYLEDFKYFLSTLLLNKKNPNEKTFNDVVELYLNLKNNYNYSFLKIISYQIKNYTEALKNYKNSLDFNNEKYLDIANKCYNYFNNDYKNNISNYIEDFKLLNELTIKKKDFSNGFDYKIYNTFIQQRTFFDSINKIKVDVDEDDLYQILKTNFKKCYTFLEFNSILFDKFEYLYYYISNLKSEKDYNKSNTVEVNFNEFGKVFNFIDKSDDYNLLLNRLNNYLSNNNKNDLKYVLDNFKNYPRLVELNNKLKSETKTAYRGLGFYASKITDVIDEDYILAKEKELQYVAATKEYYVAERFAYMRGEFEGVRRSEIGYIIEYEINNDSIILDLDVFGSKYNESEIIIDVKKAKIKNIKEI